MAILELPQRYGGTTPTAQKEYAPVSSPANGRTVNSSIRILIVEDEHTLRESCNSVLSHEGYDVTACSRGDEARDILQRHRYDVILLDLNLPKVSGTELLEFCLQINSECLV